jgi:hypothetical protein
MHQRSVISNIKFIYQSKKSELRRKLKYFQYRDGADEHLEQDGSPERWVNNGLGQSFGEIFANCQQTATTHLQNNVAARTLVISPQVDMMQAIPEDRRLDVLHELTEATVDGWFEEMDKPTPEHSTILHRAETADERPDGQLKDRDSGVEFLHAHVIVAPTYEGVDGSRQPYKVYGKQLQQLHEVARDEMERIWTRELGPERVVALNQQLTEMTELLIVKDAERAQEVVHEVVEPEPGTSSSSDPAIAEGLAGEALLDAWFGPRAGPEVDLELELPEDLDLADDPGLGLDDDLLFD